MFHCATHYNWSVTIVMYISDIFSCLSLSKHNSCLTFFLVNNILIWCTLLIALYKLITFFYWNIDVLHILWEHIQFYLYSESRTDVNYKQHSSNSSCYFLYLTIRLAVDNIEWLAMDNKCNAHVTFFSSLEDNSYMWNIVGTKTVQKMIIRSIIKSGNFAPPIPRFNSTKKVN